MTDAELEDNDGFEPPNPEIIAKAFAPEREEKPTVSPPPESRFNRLPAGSSLGERVAHDFEVQELTGTHEEIIAKARRASNPNVFISAIVECGTVSIGGHKAEPTLLDELLVGDREYLLLAIRDATYGPTIEYEGLYCVGCDNRFDLTLDLEDVPITTLRRESDRLFDVPLRKGGRARVRLPNGSDMEAYLDDEDATDSERNSVLLGRVVDTLTDHRGEETVVAGFPSVVRDELGIVDRQRILSEITKRQPGPRYDDVQVKHDCGNEVAVPVGVMHLFPGL